MKPHLKRKKDGVGNIGGPEGDLEGSQNNQAEHGRGSGGPQGEAPAWAPLELASGVRFFPSLKNGQPVEQTIKLRLLHMVK